MSKDSLSLGVRFADSRPYNSLELITELYTMSLVLLLVLLCFQKFSSLFHVMFTCAFLLASSFLMSDSKFSLHPKYLKDIIGKKVIKNLKFGVICFPSNTLSFPMMLAPNYWVLTL